MLLKHQINERGRIIDVGAGDGTMLKEMEKIGLGEIWETIEKHNSQMKENSFFTKNRKEQNIYWLHSQIKEELGNKKYAQLETSGVLKRLEEKLLNKKATISVIWANTWYDPVKERSAAQALVEQGIDVIDLLTVGNIGQHHNLGPRRPEEFLGMRRGRAVGTVKNDLQAIQTTFHVLQ